MKEWFCFPILSSTFVALLATTPSTRTIISPSSLDFVVNREQAVAEQEAQVPAYVREKVLQR